MFLLLILLFQLLILLILILILLLFVIRLLVFFYCINVKMFAAVPVSLFLHIFSYPAILGLVSVVAESPILTLTLPFLDMSLWLSLLSLVFSWLLSYFYLTSYMRAVLDFSPALSLTFILTTSLISFGGVYFIR